MLGGGGALHNFRIRPIPRARLYSAAPSTEQIEMTTGRPRITVLNDNAEFLELMSAILDDDAGYDVTTFREAATSVHDLVESRPDLIIVDLLLGGASGREIVALSRADERLTDVPIVICSADVASLRDRSDELERIGNLHMLVKPFGIDELTELVERLIGRAAVASD